MRWKHKSEALWAQVFDALGIGWKYEALEPRLSRAIRYQPDFWLTGPEVWVEIKSHPPTPGEIRVARLLRDATGRRVYLLAGWPGWGRFATWVFSEAGDVVTKRPDYAALAVCQWADCGFEELKEAFKGKE